MRWSGRRWLHPLTSAITVAKIFTTSIKPIYSTKLPLASLCGLTLAFTSATLHAQTTWDGGGGTTEYSNNLNWAGDIIPGNGNANGALIGNSSTQTVIYSTANSYTSTGAAAANSLLAGTGNAGVGSLILSGSSDTLTFGGDAYFNAAQIGSGTTATGTVTVSAGKLAIGGAGSDASINLGVRIGGSGVKNGTLIINGGTVEVGRRILMGANDSTTASNLTISSGTLDMKRTGSNGEGDLGMIRFGVGTNTVNRYTGATTINGGTLALTGTGSIANSANLQVNGTLNVSGISASTYTVASTQTLSGDGTVNATGKTLSIEGTYAVSSVGLGQQDITGGLSYAPGSVFEWDLNANAETGRGTVYDAVDVTGTLAVGSGAIFKIVLGSGVTADPFWTNRMVTRTWSDIFTYNSHVGSYANANI